MARTPDGQPSSWADVETALTAAWTATMNEPPSAPSAVDCPADQHLATSLPLYSLGEAAGAIGRINHALRFYSQSLDLARPDGYRPLEAMLWNSISIRLRDKVHYEAALAAIDQSLGLHRALGDRKSVAGALTNRGSLLRMGRSEQAQSDLCEPVAMFEEIDDQHGVATAWLNLADVLGDRKCGPEALPYAEGALARFRGNGDRRGQASALGLIGRIHRHAGDSARALDYSKQSFELSLQHADRAGAAAQLNQGYLHLALDCGRLGRALDCWYRSLDLADLTGDQMLVGQNTYALGRYLSELAHPRCNPGEYQIALGLGRRVVRAHYDHRRPELAESAMNLAFYLEPEFEFLQQMREPADHGPLRPEFEPGASYLTRTQERLTGSSISFTSGA